MTKGRFFLLVCAAALGLFGVLWWQSASAAAALEHCKGATPDEKLACWDSALTETLEEKGLERAFELFIELYRTEPELPKACHGWGHTLGEAAYDLYRSGEDIEFRRETSYCGYGFYHGFLERLIAERGGVEGARDFCVGITGSDSWERGAFRNCIHGVGHGNAASYAENTAFLRGDLQKGITLAAADCRVVVERPEERRECFDGVFNEFVLDAFYGEYGFESERYIPPDDPLRFCDVQADDLKASCYFEYMGLFAHLFNKDFAAAASYTERRIENDEHAAIAIKKLSADFMQDHIVEDDAADIVTVCRTLRAPLIGRCLLGIAIGFIAHGEPLKQWEKGFAHCASALLSSTERRLCYQSMLAAFRDAYPEELFAAVCGKAPREFRIGACGTI